MVMGIGTKKDTSHFGVDQHKGADQVLLISRDCWALVEVHSLLIISSLFVSYWDHAQLLDGFQQNSIGGWGIGLERTQ